MKTLIGAFGWATLVALTVGLASCDDTKATCTKMCSKMGECVPEQLKEITKNLPGGSEKMAEEMEKQLKKGIEECKETCDDPEKAKGKFDSEDVAKVKECLDKDCKDFMKCMEKAMKK